MTANGYRTQNSTKMCERETEEIENRRARLDERTERILDAKNRTIGIDTNALSQQVQERRARENAELAREAMYDQQSNNVAGMLQDMENDHRAAVRAEHKSVNNFRLQQAKEKKQRDLTSLANADTYVDMQTNFLKFTGEDLGKPQREKTLQGMQRDWLGQQLQMLQDKNNFKHAEQQNYEAQQKDIAELRRQAENDQAMARKLRTFEQVAFNKRLAEDKKAKEAHWRAEQERQNKEEIQGQLSSQFLNEGVSEFSGPMGFKGFTTSQRQRFLDDQAIQIQEMAAARDKELYDEQQYDQYQEQLRQQIVDIDRTQMQKKKTELYKLNRERALQAQAKNARYQYLDNVVYQNPVKEEYFQQFNQQSR